MRKRILTVVCVLAICLGAIAAFAAIVTEEDTFTAEATPIEKSARTLADGNEYVLTRASEDGVISITWYSDALHTYSYVFEETYANSAMVMAATTLDRMYMEGSSTRYYQSRLVFTNGAGGAYPAGSDIVQFKHGDYEISGKITFDSGYFIFDPGSTACNVVIDGLVATSSAYVLELNSSTRSGNSVTIKETDGINAPTTLTGVSEYQSSQYAGVINVNSTGTSARSLNIEGGSVIDDNGVGCALSVAPNATNTTVNISGGTITGGVNIVVGSGASNNAVNVTGGTISNRKNTKIGWLNSVINFVPTANNSDGCRLTVGGSADIKNTSVDGAAIYLGYYAGYTSVLNMSGGNPTIEGSIKFLAANSYEFSSGLGNYRVRYGYINVKGAFTAAPETPWLIEINAGSNINDPARQNAYMLPMYGYIAKFPSSYCADGKDANDYFRTPYDINAFNAETFDFYNQMVANTAGQLSCVRYRRVEFDVPTGAGCTNEAYAALVANGGVVNENAASAAQGALLVPSRTDWEMDNAAFYEYSITDGYTLTSTDSGMLLKVNAAALAYDVHVVKCTIAPSFVTKYTLIDDKYHVLYRIEKDADGNTYSATTQLGATTNFLPVENGTAVATLQAAIDAIKADGLSAPGATADALYVKIICFHDLVVSETISFEGDYLGDAESTDPFRLVLCGSIKFTLDDQNQYAVTISNLKENNKLYVMGVYSVTGAKGFAVSAGDNAVNVGYAADFEDSRTSVYRTNIAVVSAKYDAFTVNAGRVNFISNCTTEPGSTEPRNYVTSQSGYALKVGGSAEVESSHQGEYHNSAFMFASGTLYGTWIEVGSNRVYCSNSTVDPTHDSVYVAGSLYFLGDLPNKNYHFLGGRKGASEYRNIVIEGGTLYFEKAFTGYDMGAVSFVVRDATANVGNLIYATTVEDDTERFQVFAENATLPEGTALLKDHVEHETYKFGYYLGYTVRFLNYDNSVISSKAYFEGATIVAPAETPTKPSDESYTYSFSEYSGFTADMTMGDASTDFIAQYSSAKREYTVSYDVDGGNAISDYTNAWDTAYTLPTPTKIGYLFSAWHNAADVEERYAKGASYTIPKAAVTLVAEWTECTHVGHTYDCLGETVCDDCGKTLAAIAHEYGDWIAEVPATCTESGTVGHYVCSICGLWYDQNDDVILEANRSIAPLTHSWGEWSYADNDEHTRTCTRDANHTETVACAYGDWEITLEPTCTTAGSRRRICGVCGHEDVESIAILGHDWGEWSYADNEEHTRTCTRDANHTETVACAYGGWEITLEPTCTVAGSRRRICGICGHEDVESIAILGHDWGEWSYADNDEHTRTCTRDANHTETVACTYGTAVVAPTCTVDGYTRHTCSVCGHYYDDTVVEASGHSAVVDPAVAATCTASGLAEGSHCSVCDEVTTSQTVINALGHAYIKTSTVAPNFVARTDGYELWTCSHDANHIERRNVVEWETLLVVETEDGVPVIDLSDYVAGEELESPATRKGYNFEGWYTDEACTKKVTSLDANTLNDGVKLYSKWSAEPKGLSTGAIVGIVFGGVALAATVGFAIFWFVIKKRSFADLIGGGKKGGGLTEETPTDAPDEGAEEASVPEDEN